MCIQCAAIIQFPCNACFMCLQLLLVLQLKTVVKFHSWNYLCFYCWFYNSSTLSPMSPHNKIHSKAQAALPLKKKESQGGSTSIFVRNKGLLFYPSRLSIYIRLLQMCLQIDTNRFGPVPPQILVHWTCIPV